MTIEEIIDEKLNLENRLWVLIDQFEKKTKVKVSEVVLSHDTLVSTMGKRLSLLTRVKAEVVLVD